MPRLTEKQKAAYLKDPNRCPFCQSTDIDGQGPIQADDDYAWMEVKCNGCGLMWNDIYQLSDVQGVEG